MATLHLPAALRVPIVPWSPSSTEKFMTCPTRWWLDRQGAIGRVQDTQAMEQGSAYHEGMAAYWEECKFWAADSLVMKAIDRTILQEGDALREQGIVGVEVNLDGNDAEAARHGRYPGTCDLITQNATGLTVTDYKTKGKLEAAYVDRELRQTDRSWQLKQYAHFIQLKYGRPVTQKRKLLVSFVPLKVWLVTYPVTQHELSTWHTQAEVVWGLMDEVECGNLAAWQVESACERYGWQWRCPYYENCWDGAPITYEEAAK